MDTDDQPASKYRCYVRSAPGMWEQYEGYVDVWAYSEGEVFDKAVRELTRTSFRDRPGRDSWILQRIEKLGAGQ